jgi:drug/metabolite transporter (DMT)-like permease
LNIRAFFFVALLSFFFGSSMIASRFGVGQFNPITFNGLRMVIASVGFATIYIFKIGNSTWPRGSELWRHSILIGILGTALPMTATVASMRYQSSGLTSILLTTAPAVTVIIAHFFLTDEKMNSKKWAGILVALSGALLLILKRESGLPEISKANPLGYGLAILAILGISFSTVYSRKYMRTLKTIDVTGIRILTSGIILAPMIIIFKNNFENISVMGWIALLYAAFFGAFLGFLLDFYNVKQFGATTAAMVAYLIPIVTSLGGVLVLGETITSPMFFGVCLVITGVWIININQKRIRTDSYPPHP